MTLTLILLFLWLTTSLLAYAFELAYWSRQFPGLPIPWVCLATCAFPVIGPFATFVCLIWMTDGVRFSHGWMLVPPTRSKS